MLNSTQPANKPALANESKRGSAGDSTPRNQVLCSDAGQVLSRLGDEILDLVYIDPPFGTGKTRVGGGSQSKRYEDPMSDPSALTAWLRPMLVDCHRALKAHGSLFVHLDYRTVHYVKVALDQIFGYSNFVNEIIWCYSVGGKSPRRFARKHDTILWFGKTREYAFFPDRVRVPRKGGSHMRVVLTEDGQEVQEKTDRKTGKVYRYPVKRGKVPEDWWTDIETLNRSAAERCGWPTQKPSRLLERIILATTEPDWLVADFFSGSGTTAVVAKQHGRQYLAVDSSADAVAVANERLAAVQTDSPA